MVTRKEIDALFVDAEFVEPQYDSGAFGWDSFVNVKGIGPKTIEKIKEFVESDDPFGVHRTKRILDSVRRCFNNGDLPGIIVPTHVSIDVPPERELVCYMGIVRGKKYYDAVEQLQKRTTEELSYEEALGQIDDPHLLKYVALEATDEFDEPVRLRISRWKYPEYAYLVSHLKMNSDVVVVQGYSSDFGGVSIQVKEMVVIEP